VYEDCDAAIGAARLCSGGDLRMNALREELRDHVIVCGFGYAGRVAVLGFWDAPAETIR
jgi:hypothetical protein